jgi:hypothetical protein
MKINNHTIYTKLITTFIVVVFLLLSNISAFADTQKGKLQLSRDLANLIESCQVIPDHKYYICGSYDKPNAILGVHKDYQLVFDLWQSMPNVDSAQMEKWIRTISPEDYLAGGYSAAYILDPNGKKVGFWYSIQDSTLIKFHGEKSIEVYTPDLNQPGEIEEIFIFPNPVFDIEMEKPEMDMDD